MPSQKIATCCYCGTRAALVIKGDIRHELACSNCGAPLHDLKMLPARTGRTAPRASAPTRPRPKPTHPKQPHPRPRKVKKRSKRKGLWKEVLEEVWDFVEDIFD